MHIKYRESTIGYLITDGLKNKKFHTVNNNYMELNFKLRLINTFPFIFVLTTIVYPIIVITKMTVF